MHAIGQVDQHIAAWRGENGVQTWYYLHKCFVTRRAMWVTRYYKGVDYILVLRFDVIQIHLLAPQQRNIS